MKPARLRRLLLAAVAVAFSLPSPVRSQEPQEPNETPPKPAARSIPPTGGDDQEVTDANTTELHADERPLTGIQYSTTGNPELRHSYWMPGISYYNAIQSNGYSLGGGASWISTNYVQGNLTLLEAWNRGQLGISYTGGGYFSTDSTSGSGQDHQLGLVQELNWERLQVVFLDQFLYLPGTSFGFGAGTNLSLPGVGGSPGSISPGLGSGFVPNQSIFSSTGASYNNAFGSQLTYKLTHRSSLTMGAVYGILRFSSSGNIESNDLVLNAGYNYAISRNDSLGLLYRFSAYDFLGQPQAIRDHSPQLSYGRKITGRLALRVSGGAEITTFRVPLIGQTNHLGGAANANLAYAYKRGSINLSYSHGITGGSGIFIGASTDQIQLGASRRLTRSWNGNLQFGYAHNRNVVTASTGAFSATYDSFFFGGGANRPLGRNLNLSLAYTGYLQQSSASATCVIGTCGTDYTSQQITLGLSWHTRPFVLR